MPISIVIPTKDRPFGVVRAVASAQAALPAGGEILVVDDGSIKAADEVLRSAMGPETRVVLNPGPNSGPSAARNHGVSLAKHPVILFLDDDDEVLPNYPARIVEVANAEPDVAYGTVKRIRRKPGRKEQILSPRDLSHGRHDSDSALVSRLIGTNGMWVARKAFHEAGGFDEDVFVHEDIELCIRFAKAGAPMWFDDQVGYIVNARAADGDSGRISVITKREKRLTSFQKIVQSHGELLSREVPRMMRKYQRRVFFGRLRKSVEAIF